MVAPLKVKILYVFILLQVLTSVYALANPWYIFGVNLAVLGLL